MEANNNKACREALEVILRLVNEELEDLKDLSDEVRKDFISIRGWCDHALAEPPRQCDAGTPDEQAERFENFCLKHIGCAEETGGKHCLCCPLVKASEKITQKCELYWAQMPYKEGKTDGIK